MRSDKRTVAFQGELGAFSHAAALKLLGPTIVLEPCQSFKDVFDSLQAGTADRAVVPIENTLYGSVHENYDYLLEYEFLISGETSIRISHQLIAMPGIRFAKLKRVFSHPVALNQCKKFLQQNRHLESVPFYDTAGSVKFLMEKGLRDAAAIASRTAAATYGGTVLRRNLEDIKENFTRFFLLTKQRPKRSKMPGPWKTSVVFSTANIPSALFKAIACFSLRDLNLTKIESRPLRGSPWEYLFYVDFIGSADEPSVQSALTNLKECTRFVKLLGSYQPTP